MEVHSATEYDTFYLRKIRLGIVDYTATPSLGSKCLLTAAPTTSNKSINKADEKLIALPFSLV